MSGKRERSDWLNLRTALAAIRDAYPNAQAAVLSITGTHSKGFWLSWLVSGEGTMLAISEDELIGFSDQLDPLLCDLRWDDTVEEDEQGNARLVLDLERPAQRFRVVCRNGDAYYYDTRKAQARMLKTLTGKGVDAFAQTWRERLVKGNPDHWDPAPYWGPEVEVWADEPGGVWHCRITVQKIGQAAGTHRLALDSVAARMRLRGATDKMIADLAMGLVGEGTRTNRGIEYVYAEPTASG